MRVTTFAVVTVVIPATAQAYIINLRSLEEALSSSLSLNDSFAFDGTNSDIAQQLYIRHKAGDTDSSVTLNSVPTAVTDRLDPLNIVFNDLPGLVQRALLWDTGFAISPDNDPYVGEGTASLPKLASGTPLTHRQTILTSQHSTLGSSFCGDFGYYESAGSCKTLQILLSSEHLHGKRIPYESLDFQTALSKGSSGEVWLCEYNGQQLAAKRLLQSKDQKAKSVQAFAAEIELSSCLIHPHVVEFIGVAWNTLNNLVMLLEYVPMGSLQDYLHQNADLLSWARDKVHIAIGIAGALEYLHVRKTPIIHRDLKSNNIMLTNELEPKLIDFGVSRDCDDLTMTAAVGTPYWAAPEVLEGNRYTEQADIYSFGVVLTELDTGRIPYFDAVTEGGSKMKPFQILQDVVAGTLHPTFSEDCPQRIRRIGLACLAHDPSSRPTAQQLVRELEGTSGSDEVEALL